MSLRELHLMSENDLKILFSELGELKGMVTMGFQGVRNDINRQETALAALKKEINDEIHYLKSKAKGYDFLRGQIYLLWPLVLFLLGKVFKAY